MTYLWGLILGVYWCNGVFLLYLDRKNPELMDFFRLQKNSREYDYTKIKKLFTNITFHSLIMMPLIAYSAY
jgi:hypothetical protein